MSGMTISKRDNVQKDDIQENHVREDYVRNDNVQGGNIFKGLKDNGGVQSKVKENSFKPVWKNDAGSYLWGIQGCGLSAATKCKKRHKQEMEKSVLGSRLIVEMFSS